MAGIATATTAQIQTARDATAKLLVELQTLTDGGQNILGTAAEVTRVDALVDAQVAAIALLNT